MKKYPQKNNVGRLCPNKLCYESAVYEFATNQFYCYKCGCKWEVIERWNEENSQNTKEKFPSTSTNKSSPKLPELNEVLISYRKKYQGDMFTISPRDVVIKVYNIIAGKIGR
jgi:hypothetical protein